MAVLFGFRHPLALATSHRASAKTNKQALVCWTPPCCSSAAARAWCRRLRPEAAAPACCLCVPPRPGGPAHSLARGRRCHGHRAWVVAARATGVRTCGAAATRGTVAGTACGASAAKRLWARRPLRVSALAPRARASSALGCVVLNEVGFAAERQVGAEKALGAGRARCGFSRRRHSVGACGR